MQIEVETQSKEVIDSMVNIKVQGTLKVTGGIKLEQFNCYVNGESIEVIVNASGWSLAATYPKSAHDNPWSRWRSPAAHQVLVVLVARFNNFRAAGKLLLL
jgi:hypothetical protein